MAVFLKRVLVAAMLAVLPMAAIGITNSVVAQSLTPAEQLAQQIEAAIAALGPDATEADILAEISSVVASSNVSNAVALSALGIVQTNANNSNSPVAATIGGAVSSAITTRTANNTGGSGGGSGGSGGGLGGGPNTGGGGGGGGGSDYTG